MCTKRLVWSVHLWNKAGYLRHIRPLQLSPGFLLQSSFSGLFPWQYIQKGLVTAQRSVQRPATPTLNAAGDWAAVSLVKGYFHETSLAYASLEPGYAMFISTVPQTAKATTKLQTAVASTTYLTNQGNLVQIISISVDICHAQKTCWKVIMIRNCLTFGREEPQYADPPLTLASN